MRTSFVESNGAFWATGTKRGYIKKREKKEKRERKKGRGINGTPNRSGISRDSRKDNAESDACANGMDFCAQPVRYLHVHLSVIDCTQVAIKGVKMLISKNPCAKTHH